MQNLITENQPLTFVLDDADSGEGVWDRFYIINQTIAYLIFYLYFNLFYKIRIINPDNFIKAPRPLIIAANHVSFFDGFLINLIEGISGPHRPLRFMGVRKFKWTSLNILRYIGIIDLVYKLLGVFVVTPGMGVDKNLIEAKKILRENGVVVIYPEGKLVTDSSIAPFRIGAHILSLETGVPILPIALRIGNRRLIRKDLFVNVGEIVISQKGNVDEETIKLHSIVTKLYESTR